MQIKETGFSNPNVGHVRPDDVGSAAIHYERGQNNNLWTWNIQQQTWIQQTLGSGGSGSVGPQGPAGATGATGPQGPAGSGTIIAAGRVTVGPNTTEVINDVRFVAGQVVVASYEDVAQGPETEIIQAVVGNGTLSIRNSSDASTNVIAYIVVNLT